MPERRIEDVIDETSPTRGGVFTQDILFDSDVTHFTVSMTKTEGIPADTEGRTVRVATFLLLDGTEWMKAGAFTYDDRDSFATRFGQRFLWSSATFPIPQAARSRNIPTQLRVEVTTPFAMRARANVDYAIKVQRQTLDRL